MNTFLMGIIALLVAMSSAYSYEKIIDCGTERVWIDQECRFVGEFPKQYRCQYQLVIQNPDVLVELFEYPVAEAVMKVRAMGSYGRFEGFNYPKLGVPRIEVQPDGAGLRIMTFAYAYGTYHARRNWKLNHCYLVRRY